MDWLLGTDKSFRDSNNFHKNHVLVPFILNPYRVENDDKLKQL